MNRNAVRSLIIVREGMSQARSMLALAALLSGLHQCPVRAFAETPIDFDRQIVAVLTKAGCNAGACHGAAAGRGGFQLSLYGSRPEFDYRSIVRENPGRRVNWVRPEMSLVFRKPTGEMEHGGELRFDSDSSSATLLLDWIKQGARRHVSPKLIRFELSASQTVIGQVGESVELTATAEFEDESPRDVTDWTVLRTTDDTGIRIDEERGTATALRPGRHVLLGRYLDRVASLELLVPYGSSDDEPRHLTSESVSVQAKSHDDDLVGSHTIDELIGLKLKLLELEPSPIAGDRIFLRRVFLDLAGRLPTLEEQRGFEQASAHAKRSEVIDQLLSSDDFDRYWTLWFAKLLRVGVGSNDDEATQAYSQWLQSQVSNRTAVDSMFRSLLIADGDSHANGAANFYRVGGGPRLQTEFVAEALMGVRLRCANCHDHPLDRWKQDDYHGLAAIFATVKPGKIVRRFPSGTVIHPGTGQPAVARIPGNRDAFEASEGRTHFAAWLLSPDNSYFATAFVNRLWAHMMGRGLVDPVDDLSVTNPPSHPKLLDWLSSDFVASGYDLRHVLRRIATSDAYQRATASKRSEMGTQHFFEQAMIRPLAPEVLVDAVADVTDVAELFSGDNAARRASQLYDARQSSVSLQILGRCSGDRSCESAGSQSGGITTSLHLLNGEFLNAKLESPESRLQQMLVRKAKPTEIVERFYRLALVRNPTDNELLFWKEELGGLDERATQERCEDFVWSLLTCREFVTNH